MSPVSREFYFRIHEEPSSPSAYWYPRISFNKYLLSYEAICHDCQKLLIHFYFMCSKIILLRSFSINVQGRPQWLTVKGRTAKGYVDKVTSQFRDKIQLDSKVSPDIQTLRGFLSFC
jgi:predicted NAD/FAD-binding protein